MKVSDDYKQGYTDAVNELRYNWINELDGIINEEQSIINEYYNGDIDYKQAEERASHQGYLDCLNMFKHRLMGDK